MVSSVIVPASEASIATGSTLKLGQTRVITMQFTLLLTMILVPNVPIEKDYFLGKVRAALFKEYRLVLLQRVIILSHFHTGFEPRRSLAVTRIPGFHLSKHNIPAAHQTFVVLDRHDPSITSSSPHHHHHHHHGHHHHHHHSSHGRGSRKSH